MKLARMSVLAFALLPGLALAQQPQDPIQAHINTAVQTVGGSINAASAGWQTLFDAINEMSQDRAKAKADLAKTAGDLNAANDKNAKLEDDIKKLQAENDKLKGVTKPEAAAAPAEPKAEAPKP